MSQNFNPETLKTDFEKEEIILGIDEAGRGPVLGPMVYACAYWSIKLDKEIKNYFHFDDSKKLTPQKRENLYEKINKYLNIIQYEKIIISPIEISYKMLQRKKISLNTISHEAALKLIINSKKKGANIKKIRVDTVGNPNEYKNYLSHLINDKNIEIVVESKADSNYPCVSAASIIAKVTRDKFIDEWNFYDKNTGSGYPSDIYTVNWLKRNFNDVFGYPNFIRFSWKTVSNIFKENNCSCLWENYNEDEEIENEKKIKKKKKENDSKQNKLCFWNDNNVDFKKNNMESELNEDLLNGHFKKDFYENSNISLEIDL